MGRKSQRRASSSVSDQRPSLFKTHTLLWPLVFALGVPVLLYRNGSTTPQHLEDSLPNRIAAFEKWLDKGGAQAEKMRIAASPIHGLGAFATDHISAGELAMSLPRRLMITAAEAPAVLLKHSAIAQVRKTTSELQPLLPVALALLAEDARGADSFYAPYLATLPRSIDSPTTYPWELVDELKGSMYATRVNPQHGFAC